MIDSGNNKRIAKNTIFLYIRMGIMLIVQFYTSRVVLNVLGVHDFGLWSVIASFIISFSFISGPLTTATQRFMNFDIGKGGENLSKIFNLSLQIYIAIGFIMFLLLETAGVWFLNNRLTIDPEKMITANWTFQFAILSFVTTFIRLPYESAIIAYERMSFYAVICVLEAILLLGIVYLLLFPTNIDRLVLYGVLMFVSKFVIALCYKFYCNAKFECTKFHLTWDRSIFLQIIRFSGWNLFGAMASASSTQGLNVLLNLFFGVVVNASYGIASQVGAGIKTFVNNFQKAVNPQIVKSYASGDIDYLHNLLCMSGKYSFFLLFALVCPVMFNMDFILNFWLGNDIPAYASVFCNMMLLQMLIVCFGDPIDTAVFATGNIRNYQLILSMLVSLNILISYFLFKMGFNPEAALFVKCMVEVLILTARLLFVRGAIDISLKYYTTKTLLPAVTVAAITSVIMFVINDFIICEIAWIKFASSCTSFLLIYGVILWFIGLSRKERLSISDSLLKIIHS